MFKVPQRKEGADSILSEPDESDDEVFGSHPGTRLPAIPPLDLPAPAPAPTPAPVPPPAASAPVPAPAPASAPENPFAFDTGPAAPPAPISKPASPAPAAAAPPAPPPAPVPVPAPSQGSPTTPPNPFADLEPVSLPAVFAAHAPAAPKPAPATPQAASTPAPMPLPAAAPQPAGGNPFADFEAAPAAPAAPLPNSPKPVPAPAAEELPEEEERPRRKKKRDDRDEPEEKPSRARPATGTGGGVNPVVLFVVIGYAVLATGIAIYALFFRSGYDSRHPLSTIPDNFGEFDPATRKKVTSYRFPVDGELPPEQHAALGGTITVGQIEVTPMRIEKRRLVVETELTEGTAKPTPSHNPALVLRLSIKNNSDIPIYPMDPAFTRKADVGREDKPITRVVINKRRFFAGGFIAWPQGGSIKRKWEQQQANDYKPLSPGETREYVVFTDAQPDVVKAVESSRDTMQWRVQVRRDPIDLNGKEIPVTAVIGVDFKASDVQ